MNRHQRRANSKLSQTNSPRVAELLQAGLKHLRAQRLTEAEACYRRVLAAKPEHPDALYMLGLIAHQAGQNDLAIKLIRQAIQQNGQHAAYFLDLGIVLIQQGKLDEAIVACRQAITIKPDLAVAYSNLGVALKDQGKFDEAIDACRQAIAINPDMAVAHHNLGVALYNQCKLDEAVAACRQAIAIKPDLVEAYCNLGIALKDQGKFDEAVAACRQAIAIKPDLIEAHSNLGALLLFGQGKLDEAIEVLHQAIALNPNFADAHNNLGLALMQLGDLSEARAALEQAVVLAPRKAKYRRDLGEITRIVAGDPHLAAMELLAQDSASLSVGDRIELNFALAKGYEDVGRHAEAFRQWLDGNSLKRQQIKYDEQTTLGAMNRTKAEFTSELIRKWQNVGSPTSVPVFIVGMPRSGSTLVEQILASHPQVFGGGELMHFSSAVEDVRTEFGGLATSPLPMSAMTGEDFRDLGARYLAETERLAPGTMRITDKMPRNFIFAGLIHLALPNAPIIHTIRDPVDTCISCFSKLFRGEQNFSYDLAELGRYYRHYQELMAHWHRILPPGRILDVRYEDVVADLEGQARRIIAHCGLDWNPRCLAFHQTERPVRTFSAMQVRQPIYNSAVGRWRVYKDFLDPLFAELSIADGSNRNRAASTGHNSFD